MEEKKGFYATEDDKQQMMNYNNPLFYCLAGQTYYPPEMTIAIPTHWHEDIEYLYVFDGTLDYSINGKRLKLNKGEGIIVNSKRIHSNQSVRGQYVRFNYVIIHPSYLCASPYIEKKYIAPVICQDSFDYVLLHHNDWTSEIIDTMNHLFEGGPDDSRELEIIEATFHTVRVLFNNLKPKSSFDQSSSIYVNTFKTMITFINNHFSEKISLDEIAESGNVGKTLCAKIFKIFTSKTPGEYLIHYRINKSLELLTDGNLKITDIAYRSGFNSASHYTKIFKDIVKCTPNKYRAVSQEQGAAIRF